jgi:hypothetical protein
MKKVYLNRSQIVKPWGGGANFVNAMHTYAPSFGVELHAPTAQLSPDTIVIAGLDNEDQHISAEQAVTFKAMLKSKKDVKVILRINENDARKNTTNVDGRIKKLAEHCDEVVFVSHWLKDYYEEKNIKCKKSHVILNGVDKNIYKPGQKFDNGKINIVTHHWSNNPLKGFDIYEQLDEFVGKNIDKYSFTYIGRDRFTFKNTNVIRPMFGEKLGEELGKYDVYISASRFDPGPNHVLESMACKIPTYVHLAGGGCVEFAGKDFAFSTLEQFISKITDSSKMNDCSILQPWEDCIKQYCDLI